MKSLVRGFAVVCVFGMISVAWFALGAIMMKRTDDQSRGSRERVSDLWGTAQAQAAPVLVWGEEAAPGAPSLPVDPARSEVAVALDLDQRLRGLVWYSLYDVTFDATYRFDNDETLARSGAVQFRFPDPNGIYDALAIEIDGVSAESAPQSNGALTIPLEIDGNGSKLVRITYKSRGIDSWVYKPTGGGKSLKDFRLDMTTDFDAIDFPSQTLSPSERHSVASGTELTWRFDHIVSGYGMGMIMPTRIQPGELAQSLSFSAPISLMFFFLVIAVLAKLRDLDIHPINYFFLGTAFFAFHLLFAYSVDHLPVAVSFALSSIVSVAMVTCYLRLVVSPRFAFVEAGLAQMVYLVGFSMAHFLEGFTGLTLTVLSIATLFLLMLLTGRVRWSRVLGEKPGIEGQSGALAGAASSTLG